MAQVLGSKGGIHEYEEPLKSRVRTLLKQALGGEPILEDNSLFEVAAIGHIRRFAEGKLSLNDLHEFLIKHARLRQVSLDVTNRCNLNCSHCFYSADSEEIIPIEKWQDILGQIYALGVRTVTVAGREPFISPITMDVLRGLNSLKIQNDHPFQYGVVTNGTLLHDYVEGLSSLDIDYLDISIDGLRETHDQYRGRGNFDRSLKGLRHALALNAAKKIFVASILHQENLKEIPYLVKYFLDEGVSHFIFGLFFPTPDTPEYLILKEWSLPIFLNDLERKARILNLNRPLEIVIEISIIALSYLPQLFNSGILDFNNLLIDKVGNLYSKKSFENGAEIFIQFPPFMEEKYWSLARIKNGYYLGGCEALAVKRDWEKYAVGNVLTESLQSLFKKALEAQVGDILHRIDSSVCKGKPCFKYCLGGDHLYRAILGGSEVDYVCQKRQAINFKYTYYPHSHAYNYSLGM